MFWIGLIIFAYTFEKICLYIAEERKYKNTDVLKFKNAGYYNNNFDKNTPILEDVMFDTGLSDEELDEILPDYNIDLEYFK